MEVASGGLMGPSAVRCGQLWGLRQREDAGHAMGCDASGAAGDASAMGRGLWDWLGRPFAQQGSDFGRKAWQYRPRPLVWQGSDTG